IGAAAAGVYRQDAVAATRGLPARAAAAAVGRLAAPLRAARGLVAGRRDDHARPAATTAPLLVRRTLGEVAATAAGAPASVQRRVREVVEEAGRRLPRRLTAAVDGVRVAPPRRRWWTPVAALLSLAELCIVVGALWLGVLAV